MSDHIRWLHQELEQWTRAQILSEEQAEKIRTRYPAPKTRNVSWGTLVFSGLGAVVIGLGVILLFAYNWADIPRAGKLAIVLSSTLGAHLAGLWLRSKQGWYADLGEACSLLGTLLFGSGIWLIAQAYHIDEHFPNGFLIWGLGALGMVWALDSVPQGILAAITLTIWGCTEVFRFDTPTDWAFGLVGVALGAQAWRKRSGLLTAVVLACCYVLILANAGFWNGTAGVFTTAFSFSGLLWVVGRLVRDEERRRVLSVAGFFGLCGFLVCSYVLSFHGAADDLLRWHLQRNSTAFVTYGWLLFLVALAGWGVLLYLRSNGKSAKVHLEEWLCPIALLYGQGLALTGFYLDAWFIAIVFNLVLLGISVSWMLRGCREGKLGLTICGSLLLAAVVFARYFDLFSSLALRGLVFLVLGAVLFGEGFFYRRMRQGERQEGGQP